MERTCSYRCSSFRPTLCADGGSIAIALSDLGSNEMKFLSLRDVETFKADPGKKVRFPAQSTQVRFEAISFLAKCHATLFPTDVGT